MSNTKIEDSIISAVEILTERAIDKAGFDKTIQATIKRCENKSAGQYVVKYQDSTFYAYATSPDVSYGNNTLVYVLVPQGDFKNNKTIIGAVKKLGADYITMLGNEAYEVIGRNLVDAAFTSAELCSYDAEPCNIPISLIPSEECYRYIKEGRYLQIKASVWNSLAQEQIDKAGDYYVGIKIKFLDNSGNEVIRDYRLGIAQMAGNPYTATLPVKQSFLFDLDGEKIISIEGAYVGKSSFIENPSYTDTDIFFSGIEVNVVEPLEFVGDGKYGLAVITKAGRTISSSDVKPLTLEGQVKVNGIVSTNKIEYLWFIQDDRTAAGDGYDTRAGVGWRKLTDHIGPTQNVLTVPASSLVAPVTYYRCLAIVDNEVVLSKIVKLYNIDSTYSLSIVSSAGSEFYYDQGEYYLTATLTGATGASNVEYHWMRMDHNGIYAILNDGNDDENLYADSSGGQFQAQDIINFVKYHCIAIDTITGYIVASAELTVTNKLEGGGYSLVIKNGTQIFKYNELGLSPAHESNVAPMTIPALYYQIYSPEGDLKIDTELDANVATTSYWMVPEESASMIANAVARGTIAEDGYYKVKQKSLTYSIAKSFNPSKDQNEIQLIVSYNGEVLTASTNFTFTKEGGNGTNGTVYALRVVEVGKNKYSYYLYDGLGERIEEGTSLAATTPKVQKITWSMHGTSRDIAIKSGKENSATTEVAVSGFSSPKLYQSADILKLSAKIDGSYWIYAYYPIIRNNIRGMTCELVSGAREVIFNPDLTISDYDHSPYRLRLIDGGNDVTENYTQTWSYDSNVFKLDSNNGLRVVGNYSASTTDCVYCEVTSASGSKGFLKVPVLLLVNRYSNSALNGWDGLSVEIDNAGKYILAPQIGAGFKDDDNKFTGVVMGTQKDTSKAEQVTGLFGYNKGELTFRLNAATGHLYAKDAEIEGKITATEGQIGKWVLDKDGYLRSEDKTVWLHPTGVSGTANKICKTDYVFKAGSNFGVTKSGSVYAKTGKIGGFVLDNDSLKDAGDGSETGGGSGIWLYPSGKGGILFPSDDAPHGSVCVGEAGHGFICVGYTASNYATIGRRDESGGDVDTVVWKSGLSGYAKKTDIPDTSDFATAKDLRDLTAAVTAHAAHAAKLFQDHGWV